MEATNVLTWGVKKSACLVMRKWAVSEGHSGCGMKIPLGGDSMPGAASSTSHLARLAKRRVDQRKSRHDAMSGEVSVCEWCSLCDGAPDFQCPDINRVPRLCGVCSAVALCRDA